MKTNLKGFTLVELVITIAIVIILAVVSVPIYKGYTEKAKMAEGYALLGTIFSAQKNYYSEYGMFLDDQYSSTKGEDVFTCNENVLGIDARGNKYYTCFNVCLNYDPKVGFKPAAQAKDLPIIVLTYNLTKGSNFGSTIPGEIVVVD